MNDTPSARPGRRRRLLRLLPGAVAVILLAAAVGTGGRLILFSGPYRQPQRLPGTIIDLHCHAAGIGAGDSGCHVSPAMRANFRFRAFLEAFGVTIEDLEQNGDAIVIERIARELDRSEHVDRAVVLALDGVIDPDTGELDLDRTDVFVPNEFVGREVARHSNLLFGASINPLRRDALQRLEAAASNGAVLVKWIPSVMDIDPADPAHIPFYVRMRELSLPLLSHTGTERSFTRARDELADPRRLRLPLEQGLLVIAAHTGAGGRNDGQADLRHLLALMREFPNLHADISALTQANRIGVLREVLEAPETAGRLVYGSDFPLINTALVSPWYFPLNLSVEQCAEIDAVANAWDRDVRLKQALGVPSDVFARTAVVLPRP